NFRCPRGELDIIARDGETAVFVEVKTRRTAALGSPLEAVTRPKPARIRMLAGIWLSGQPELYPATRIDAVGIITEPRLQYFHCPNIQVDSCARRPSAAPSDPPRPSHCRASPERPSPSEPAAAPACPASTSSGCTTPR